MMYISFWRRPIMCTYHQCSVRRKDRSSTHVTRDHMERCKPRGGRGVRRRSRQENCLTRWYKMLQLSRKHEGSKRVIANEQRREEEGAREDGDKSQQRDIVYG